VDLWLGDTYQYIVSPMAVGIFEFTMMRLGPKSHTKKMAKLFHEYLSEGSFYSQNCGDGQTVTLARSLPHEGSVADEDHVEVLDYEKASAIIEEADKFSIGLCSCRHEKLHIGEKKCQVPLESCSSIGKAADYLIRNKLAREVSKSEMKERLARSKEMGLVFNADNVKQNVSFICHCCGCCCNLLLGISKHGYPNAVVTSNFIAREDEPSCLGCGKCSRVCPINAITMHRLNKPIGKKKFTLTLDESVCLGCGVCALSCSTGSMKLVKRKQRVLHPETTLERVILQCLERGTLQNQIFSNPNNITQEFMRTFFGAFLRLPPVKKSLMSDTLRSVFLASLNSVAGSEAKNI
jgi:formate hydrogenlyase subunit 6/NADH:ubiquinone oxidoreductase subunit I